MNFFKPFKLHYFSYRKIFLMAFFLEAFASFLVVFFFNDAGIFFPFTVVFLAFMLVLSFVFGFYEYNHLCDHYLNFKTNRLGFYFSSLLFGLINALLKTACAGLVFWWLSQTPETLHGLPVAYTLVFPYLKMSTYLLLFLILLLGYLLASLLALILRKSRFGRPGFYLLTFLTISIYFQKIYSFLQAKTALLFALPSLFQVYLPVLAVSCLLLSLFVAWQASIIDLKK